MARAMSDARRNETPVSEDVQKCIQNCMECHDLCEQTLAYCLQMGGPHAEASHLQSLRDCADACAACAESLASGSEGYIQLSSVCAQVCERCAQSCEQFGNDAEMKACAEVCRRCAESCRSMAGTSTMAR